MYGVSSVHEQSEIERIADSENLVDDNRLVSDIPHTDGCFFNHIPFCILL